jgi:hypothetical protein
MLLSSSFLPFPTNEADDRVQPRLLDCHQITLVDDIDYILGTIMSVAGKDKENSSAPIPPSP